MRRLTGGYQSSGQSASADNEMYISTAGSGLIQEGLLGAQINYIGGVIPSEQIAQFKRLVVRATKCQVFVHSFDLHIHAEDQLVHDPYHARKSIFVLCFQDGSTVQDKLRRICNSFTGFTFEVKIDGIDKEIEEQQREMESMRSVIRSTKTSFKEYLQTKNESRGADVSVFKLYKLFIMKEKTIYSTLNMLKQNPTNDAILMGLVWAPRYFDFGMEIQYII